MQPAASRPERRGGPPARWPEHSVVWSAAQLAGEDGSPSRRRRDRTSGLQLVVLLRYRCAMRRGAENGRSYALRRFPDSAWFVVGSNDLARLFRSELYPVS